MNKKDIKDFLQEEIQTKETGKVSANVDDSTRAENLETSKVSDAITLSVENLISNTVSKIRQSIAKEISESLESFRSSSESNEKFYNFASHVTSEFTHKVSASEKAVPATIDADGVTLTFGIIETGYTQIDFINYLASLKSCVSLYNSIESKKARQEKEISKLRESYDILPEAMKLACDFETYYNMMKKK